MGKCNVNINGLTAKSLTGVSFALNCNTSG